MKIKKEQVIREVLSYTKTIFLSMIVTWFVCSKIVTYAQVPTGSMEDTIDTGSKVILNKVAYIFDEPERGDIIAFKLPDDESQVYLKRIIGLPGEMIEGRNSKVYINGEELAEPYLNEISDMGFGPYIIPEDSYFMMGDNRNNSWDSRYWNNKYVNCSAIEGKVSFEFYPHIKFLK